MNRDNNSINEQQNNGKKKKKKVKFIEKVSEEYDVDPITKNLEIRKVRNELGETIITFERNDGEKASSCCGIF